MHSTETELKSKCISNITVHINIYKRRVYLRKRLFSISPRPPTDYSNPPDYCYIEPFPAPPPPDYSHPPPVYSILQSTKNAYNYGWMNNELHRLDMSLYKESSNATRCPKNDSCLKGLFHLAFLARARAVLSL